MSTMSSFCTRFNEVSIEIQNSCSATLFQKPSKATKTLVAAAVAGLMAMGSTAFAADTLITNDSFGSQEGQYDSTKFISGNGGKITIQTNGDAKELALAIKGGNLEAIQNALGANSDEDGNFEVAVVGLAGGKNFIDSTTAESIGLLVDLTNSPLQGLIPEEYKTIIQKIGSLVTEDHLNVLASNTFVIDEGIDLTIGGNGTNPLLVGTVGSDRIINASLEFGTEGKKVTIVNRNGDSNININSGNVISLIGASSAINVGGISAQASIIKVPTTARETHVQLTGSTNIVSSGSSSTAGIVGAGSAIAISGIASSTVTGSSNITIDTTANSKGYEGCSKHKLQLLLRRREEQIEPLALYSV